MSRARFTAEDRRRIQEAVREAEKKISGEIVPYVVNRSDTYGGALWLAAACGGVLGALVVWVVHEMTMGWVPLGALEELAIVGVFAVAGALLANFSSAALRFFAGRAVIEQRVARRAAEAFTTEQVFATKDRTGILLFVSLAEHRVLVVADTGIHRKVADGTWEGVVATVVNGIRAEKAADGMIEAMRECMSILEKHGFNVRPDDRDELPDHLRTSRR